MISCLKKGVEGLVLVSLIGFALISCTKEPGVGGDATLSGRVTVKDYNTTFTELIGEYPAEDVYVYITYGDHPGYDDRVKTDYEGEYQFEHLYIGQYELYVYSKDSTLVDLNDMVPVVQELEITERKEHLIVPEFIIYD